MSRHRWPLKSLHRDVPKSDSMSFALQSGELPVVKHMSIGVALAAAFALVAGVTRAGGDVLGFAADPMLMTIGAVGLVLTLTTLRSPLISPFLRVFSTIF